MNWLDFLAPYKAQWWLIAIFVLAAAIYIRGLLRRRRSDDIPGALAFLIGLGAMYFVMQTRFDYYAQFMFFMHRLQHLVLHHLAPFLIALSMPSAVLAAGAPAPLRNLWRRGVASPPARVYRSLQQPVVAGILFAGAVVFWLLPAIHFDAMISPHLYWTMNVTMALGGVLFWWFILDPRPPGSTPTTRSIGLRALVLWGVMPPQIIIGAYIALSPDIIYDIYRICGRAWPISPLLDQQLGGLITWMPAAMMSVIANLVLLRFAFRHEREREREQPQTNPRLGPISP